ncbi:MAG: hypothetical protein ACI9XB_004615 [Gammaproteobacteria bacterium]|jgi:hypothetical protein
MEVINLMEYVKYSNIFLCHTYIMKSFISGFESIFGVSAEEIEMGVAEDQVEVLPFEESPEIVPKAKSTPKRKRYGRKVRKAATSETRTTSKNFTSDLESLFRDALTDSFEEALLSESEAVEEVQAIEEKPSHQPEKNIIRERKASPEDKPVRARRRISTPGGSGLDLLIRQTSDETILEYESLTKRVSFVFDKKKLKKLKRIAKQRQLFLKDVVGEVVAKFINEYETDNGEVTLD